MFARTLGLRRGDVDPFCSLIVLARLRHPFAFFEGWETTTLSIMGFPELRTDALNRIATAYTQGTNWGEMFTVDPWGNLTNKGPVSGKTNYESLSASATSQNRLTGFNYDPAGNMTLNGSAAYYYDAENHMTSASGGYSYIGACPEHSRRNGDGNRVEKCTAGTTIPISLIYAGWVSPLAWGTTVCPLAEYNYDAECALTATPTSESAQP